MAQEPDAAFQALMERIRCRSEQLYRYLGGTEQPRRWMLPPPRGWDGDPLNISDVKKPFDRESINEEATDNLNATDGGTVGVGAGKTLQIGYFGMMERAFRVRHMTIARAHAHVAGRRKGHSNAAGIHTGDIIAYIQNMLSSGGTGS